MIKKLIPISVILALAVSLGLVGLANAAYNDVTFVADATIGISDLVVKSGAQVVSFVVNDNNTATVTLASSSSITITSPGGHLMKLDHPQVATCTCTAGVASIAIPYNSTYPTVILSLIGTDCAAAGTPTPTINSVIVKSTTTVEVAFSDNVEFVTSSAAFLAAVTNPPKFAGVSPSAGGAAISGRVLTLTFASGALAGAGVKDNSVLVLPASQIQAVTGGTDFAGTTTQVVTDLATINQLYDFTFAVQVGQNFMSIPYDVSTTLANSYTEGAAVISIQTIDNAGGIFETVLLAGVPTPTSFDPLYGYYINSDTALYLRLNKKAAASQSLTFSRTFTATGWHLIGVASDNVSNCLGAAANLGDAAVLYANLGASSYYDKVVDMSVGRTGDNNATAAFNGTYDSTLGVYKALLTDAYIVARTKIQIDATSGIEFNHGEAYFIWINTVNAKYTGEKVATGNLVL